VGLVTTARVTHAMPASFVANVADRDMEAEIAQQYLQLEVDVLLGGGNRWFSPNLREDGIDVWKMYLKSGYKVVSNRQQLLSQSEQKGRLLGTFADSHLPYSIDRRQQSDWQTTVPSLVDMMSIALERLVHHEQGFVLQVEGGRIDHAAHANDAGALVHEQLAFDECIAVARTFARQHKDTLVIVTTDHGTGGCHINGVGQLYNDTSRTFAALANFKGSWQSVRDHFRAHPPTVEALGDKLRAVTGLQFADRQIKKVLEMAQTNQEKYAVTDYLGALVSDHIAVGWTSHMHTGEQVELCAFGPGSAIVPPYLENWQLHGKMRTALGI